VPATNSGKAIPEAVYFGNGCFWGRQFDFVQTGKPAPAHPSTQRLFSGSNSMRQLFSWVDSYTINMVVYSSCLVCMTHWGGG
jgi:hypothetical protein